jgi:hypothetical protein
VDHAFASPRSSPCVEFEEIVGYHLEQAYRHRAELGPVVEQADGCGEVPACEGALPSGAEPLAGPRCERPGVLVDAGARVVLEPAREALVQLGAQRFWQPSVCRVVDECVLEAKALLAGKQGAVGLHEHLACQRVEVSPSRRSSCGGKEPRDRLDRELPPGDRRSLGDRTLARTKTVEPRGEDRVNRRRVGGERFAAVRGEQGNELLCEERIALRARDDPAAQVAAQAPSAGQVVDQRLGVLGRERRQLDRARCPGWTRVE